jgi:oxazoline/thiazoline synthase
MQEMIKADSRVNLQELPGKYDAGMFAALREYELPWESPIHLCSGELKPEFCQWGPGDRRAISKTVRGAGTTAQQARMNCLGEALERYSGIFRGDEPRLAAPYTKIADEAIHPDQLTLFSESQYSHREEWNRREGRYNFAPERFDSKRRIDWSPVWSITEQQTKYLPTAYCYFGYPFDPAHDFCRPDSNGNAAGSGLDDAIVRGFLELVERECAAVWWYNQVRRPAVDIESFGAPDLRAIRNLHHMIGHTVEVLDISLAPEIAVFVAVSQSDEPAAEHYALGFGAHFDPATAVRRALTELSQLLPALLSDRQAECFLPADSRQTDMSFLAHPELAVKLRSDFRSPLLRDTKQLLAWCADLAKSWGLDLLVLDQSRPDIGMPVVKVVVPGMRSWWARLAPGRLYSLPVDCGWLLEPKNEAEMNASHLIL